MAYIIACLMAALSFVANKALLRLIGPQVILTWGPIVEEGAKTLLAWYLAADIVATHVIFRVLEGVYDYLIGTRYRTQAALTSVVCHTLFGGITVTLLGFTGSIWIAVGGAVIAHAAWNRAVIRLQR